ncbi:DNA-3-methyladenine glycosylase [Bacillus sp. DTU_2020_1000418_1_SI_GHA_SEK_038]|uniref:DNA-3-methyladenine glycosylase family protein n=1 Tax=Bacillus sp. DTU_2020_1000418_1_SI_GHA_SEK_038 TaxID=3077585 RepID=UPI0028ECBA94|nr:DNA-3-methyladenine glycosylase [Bacillus sp. DTU_2020_1000418_1_SI_GHA_SEK_038]WNS76409.1 DNA-3-methyladenine glycosylase [Bacillus sp. DTU_2020_1000418_1_SI_GHA_SEK_038]
METIQIKGPYNFDLVLDRLSIDPLNQVDIANRSVKVPLLIEGEPLVARVTAVGTTLKPEFIIEGTEGKYKEKADKRLAEIFQWHVPLEMISDHFKNTDLKEIFEKHHGTPIVLDFSPYNCLLKCIIHQQLNMSFAHTLTERFVKTFGFEKEGVWFYPLPEKVADLTVEDLRELQFSGRKAEYVIGIAKEVIAGNLNFDELKTQSDEDVFKQLIKLRGVGPWTVQNFLMFGLGRPNLFPVADIGIQNALKKLYQLEAKPALEEMESYSKGWEPYLSYASLYLWRSIE